ncbi:MAG: RNA polymerase sigma factor [Cyclonatronaceae bacterium]
MFNFLKRRKRPAGAAETARISNLQWQKGLAHPPDRILLEALRGHLVRGLRPALSGYVGRELEDFIEDTAQDAMLVILAKLNTFRGESRFTTWALKIAVRQGLTELRRKKWQDISLDRPAIASEEGDKTTATERFMRRTADMAPDPAAQTHEQMMLAKVLKMMNEELSEKQRTAIQSLMIQEMPIVVVAEKMNIKQNALYKLVHDARLKLRKRLAAEGIDLEELYA